MMLYELLDELVLARTKISNTDLKTEVTSIQIGTNDAIVIKLGTELVFLKQKQS